MIPGEFYRKSAELRHEDDGRIETLTTFQDVRNFTISADFEVPYSKSVGDWSVGFVFRNPNWNNLSYVAITQDGRYFHRERHGGNTAWLDEGYVSDWNRRVGDKNKIRLDVVENTGLLFVDSRLVAELDVSGADGGGKLAVAIGFFAGDEVVGETTRVSDIKAKDKSKPIKAKEH